MSIITSVLLLAFAYVCGSVNSAVILCKICALPDPRSSGSNNPGATNVLRLAGKKYALMVMIADILKGTIPLVIAQLMGFNSAILAYMGLAAVLGHIYPCFFNFKGGKGVATAIGVGLGLQLILGFLVAITWLAVARGTRFSSMASIIGVLSLPFYSLYTIGNILFFTPLCLIAVVVIFKHHENINRLMAGDEPQIDFSKFKKKTDHASEAPAQTKEPPPEAAGKSDASEDKAVHPNYETAHEPTEASPSEHSEAQEKVTTSRESDAQDPSELKK